MIRINIFYNEGFKNGKKYKVAHTLDFGYDLSISLGQGVQVLKDADGQLYILYDPAKAGMRVQQNGYLQLVIGA